MLDVEQVSSERLMAYTRAITQWKRRSSTEEELRAARYMEAELRAMGYATQLILHDAYISLPGEAKLEVTDPQQRDIACIPNGFCLPTDSRGLRAELVFAGKGSESELAASGAAGRVALVEGWALADLLLRAAQAGAKGVICIGGRYPHQTCPSPIWGSPAESNVALLPRVHVLSVNRDNGEALRELCRHGPVQVHFTAQIQTGWTKTPIVLADLAPGDPDAEAEKFVLFAAHADSAYYGAMDNGSANAAMLELARLVVPQRGRMRRGLRYAIWSGHEQGRYSSSAWYADNFWFDLEKNCQIHLNVDSLGAIGSDHFRTNSMPETAGLGKWAVQQVAGKDLHAQRVGRDSDQSFLGVGIPMLFGYIAVQEDGWLGWWWHTPHDTVDKIDPERLLRDTQIFALVLSRMLGDPILPLDYAASAADIRSNLEELAEVSKGKFDLSAAVTFASKLEELCTQLPKAARSPREINACLQDLGRILIPATYTAAGRFVPDPAMPMPFLPRLQGIRRLADLDPDSDHAKFLVVDLVRARNELVYALRRACARVEALIPPVQGWTTSEDWN